MKMFWLGGIEHESLKRKESFLSGESIWNVPIHTVYDNLQWPGFTRPLIGLVVEVMCVEVSMLKFPLNLRFPVASVLRVSITSSICSPVHLIQRDSFYFEPMRRVRSRCGRFYSIKSFIKHWFRFTINSQISMTSWLILDCSNNAVYLNCLSVSFVSKKTVPIAVSQQIFTDKKQWQGKDSSFQESDYKVICNKTDKNEKTCCL